MRKTWSVISKLFLLSCIFYYISNWLTVLEFYLKSFLNMKSWRVKFRNFLGNFPVHYTALFINKTIVRLLLNYDFINGIAAYMAFHDGLWYFFRCFKSNTHSWYTPNFESANETLLCQKIYSCFFSKNIVLTAFTDFSRR